MTYSIFAYSTIGAILTHEILTNLGYTLNHHDYSFVSQQDLFIVSFKVDTLTKKVSAEAYKLNARNKATIAFELRYRRAFKATEVINKYLTNKFATSHI